jgi:hypothetical protein
VYPAKLKFSLGDHVCQTVPEAGFAGKKNGQLLLLAESSGFEVLVTMDKGLEYEQNLTLRKIAILLFRAKSNRLADLLLLAPICLEQMRWIRPGAVIRVGG